MSKKKEPENPEEDKPKVHSDLDGLDIKINELGEIEGNYDINKLNKFLNKNLEDKKLKDRDDLDELKEEKE